MSFLTREKNGARGDTILWGWCAQTPGHIVVQENGFSCTHIVYHNGRYFAHRKKYNFFTFLYNFSKKIGFMEKIVQKKEKNLGLQF